MSHTPISQNAEIPMNHPTNTPHPSAPVKKVPKKLEDDEYHEEENDE